MKSTTWTAPQAGRLDALVRQGTELSNAQARRAVATGKVFLEEKRTMDPATHVPVGARLRLEPNAPNPARTEPDGVRLVYRDDYVLVIDKPAGLNTTPSPDREDEPTALHAAGRLCRGPARPKIVHRLDRETSGLLLFARTVPAARKLREALDKNEVQRVYRCVVQGVPTEPAGVLTSMLVRDAGEGRRGSRTGTFRVRNPRSPDPGPMPGFGKLAITRYQTIVVKDGRAALEVWLSTGRTHQIRIHMSEMGCPVLGERVYGRIAGAPRQALHSAKLSFAHPQTGALLSFVSPWPADLAEVTPRGPDW